LGAELISDATVWGAFEDNRVAALIAERSVVFSPRRLILATGAYERPVPMPGWTLPGVMTTGAAQTLLRAYRVAPGRRVIVAGNGPLNFQVAAELVAAGIEIAAVVEAAPRMGARRLASLVAAVRHAPDLIGNGLLYLVRLWRAGTLVRWGHTIVRVEGSGRVCRATIAPLDAAGRPDLGRAESFAVDTVCLGYGFVPSAELERQLGCRMSVDPRTGESAPEHDCDGATSVPGVYVVGDSGGLQGARAALTQGALAGFAAARSLGHALDAAKTAALRRDAARHAAFQSNLWRIFSAPPVADSLADDDTIICRCEEVSLGTLRSKIVGGTTTPRGLKASTRVAMGRCQGRYCGPMLRRILSQAHASPTEDEWFRSRPPARPIPIAPLVAERPDWGRHTIQRPPSLSVGKSSSHALGETDVAIIGGGIVGCSLAWFLAREGIEALVIDAGELNSQSSGTNAGNLHVQLQSYFVKGTKDRLYDAKPALHLFRMAAQLWREIAAELGTEIGLRIHGGIMLAETEEEFELIRRKSELERSCGLSVEILSAADVRSTYPQFSHRVVGAELCPDEGSVNPLLAGPALADAATRAGARLVTGAPVLAIEREGGHFSVITARGHLRSTRLVNATGPWGGEIAGMLGTSLPIGGAPLHMNVTAPAPPLVDRLVEHASRHLTMKQVPSGNFIIGGGWPSRIDPGTGRLDNILPSIEGNLWVAQRVLPAIGKVQLLRTWTGIAPVIADNTPILGEVPGVPGFYHCVTEYGYSLGPLCANALALALRGKVVPFDLATYSVARFSD
jgi:glycine/D-amino acid oxidase-like deaminating enzyme